MKTKRILFAVTIMVFSMGQLSAVTFWPAKSKRDTVVFNVPMDCHNCQEKIEKYMAFEKGVKGMETSLEKQTVQISYDIRKTDVNALQQGFKKIGYEATIQKPDSLNKK